MGIKPALNKLNSPNKMDVVAENSDATSSTNEEGAISLMNPTPCPSSASDIHILNLSYVCRIYSNSLFSYFCCR